MEHPPGPDSALIHWMVAVSPKLMGLMFGVRAESCSTHIRVSWTVGFMDSYK